VNNYLTSLVALLTFFISTHSGAAEQLLHTPDKLDRNVRDCRKENLSLKELSKRGLIDTGNWHDSSWDNPFLIEIDDQVDLNNDGVCEIRTINKTASDASGNLFSYYQKTNGTYKKLFSIFGTEVSFLEERNGYSQVQYNWKQITDTIDKNFFSTLLTFNGEKYQRLETHKITTPDYNKVFDKRTKSKLARGTPALAPQVINDSIVLELYDQFTSYIFTPPYHKPSRDMSLDGADLWVAQEGGLLKFRTDQGTWLAYGKKQGFLADGIEDIGIFDHSIFASTYRRKINKEKGNEYRGDHRNLRLDPERGVWQDADLRCTPNRIEQYDDLLIYACDNGIWIYEPETGNQKPLTPENSALIHSNVKDFMIAGDELLTVGPGKGIASGVWAGGGISILKLPDGQGRHFGVEEGLANSFCSGVATTPGKIWVALYKTERGLNVYDLEHDRWQLLKLSSNGIKLGGEKLMGIGKHLVIARYGALVFLNTETLEAREFTERDGLPAHIISDLVVGRDSLWVLMYSFKYDREKKRQNPDKAGLVRFELNRLPFPTPRTN
jgi:hypothetical protein